MAPQGGKGIINGMSRNQDTVSVCVRLLGLAESLVTSRVDARMVCSGAQDNPALVFFALIGA